MRKRNRADPVMQLHSQGSSARAIEYTERSLLVVRRKRNRKRKRKRKLQSKCESINSWDFGLQILELLNLFQSYFGILTMQICQPPRRLTGTNLTC